MSVEQTFMISRVEAVPAKLSISLIAGLMLAVPTLSLCQDTAALNVLNLSVPSAFLMVGGTTQLHVAAPGADGSQLDLTASSTGTKYESNNLAVVNVSSEGIITAVGMGVATVQASNFDFFDSSRPFL